MPRPGHDLGFSRAKRPDRAMPQRSESRQNLRSSVTQINIQTSVRHCDEIYIYIYEISSMLMMWLVMIYSIVLRDFGPAATMAFNSCSFTGCTITPPPSLPSWQPEQPGKGWKRKSPSDFRRVPWLQRLSFWSFLAFFYRNELSCKRGVMLGCTWMVVTGSWFWPIGSGFESLALQERHRAVGAVGQTPEGDQWGDQWGAWRQWEAWQELRASTKGWRPWQWQQEAGHWDCWWRARENYQESLVDVGRILVLECEEGWQWKHRFRCCWFRWEPKECWAWGPNESSKVAEHACLARTRPDNFWKSPELWWDSPVSMEDHQLPGERKGLGDGGQQRPEPQAEGHLREPEPPPEQTMVSCWWVPKYHAVARGVHEGGQRLKEGEWSPVHLGAWQWRPQQESSSTAAIQSANLFFLLNYL